VDNVDDSIHRDIHGVRRKLQMKLALQELVNVQTVAKSRLHSLLDINVYNVGKKDCPISTFSTRLQVDQYQLRQKRLHLQKKVWIILGLPKGKEKWLLL